MTEWITKKEKPKSWITKKKKEDYKEIKVSNTQSGLKEKPTKWITKKQPKTNWITKKEAKEHDTTSARKWITKKNPVRSPHGLGSIVKKIISKVKPKPKGKGLGSGIKPSEAKDILKSPGKSWGKTRAEYLREYAPYFGGRSLKKEMKEGVHARNKASKKVFKSAKGKAAGGRIGLSHGGSVGAAIRGRGAEIK